MAGGAQRWRSSPAVARVLRRDWDRLDWRRRTGGTVGELPGRWTAAAAVWQSVAHINQSLLIASL